MAASNGREALGIVWEGDQQSSHSFAAVNREICRKLIERGHELALLAESCLERPPSAAAADPLLTGRFKRSLSRPVAAHVRHQWPPNFTPPPAGHWVMIQPWEYGSVPNQATVNSAFSFDNANRLTQIYHSYTPNGLTMVNPLATYSYGYDNANEVSTYTGPEGTLNYSYDLAGELTGVTGARNETYGFDLNGNRTMTGYVTGTGNRLSSAVISGVTYTYSYDNEGNMLTKTGNAQTVTYTWDYRNRLTEVVITQGTVTVQDDKFTYDLNDRRIGKLVQGGTQQWTVPDGDNPYADFSGTTLTYRYLEGQAMDSLLARFDGTATTTVWYLGDNLGSVRQVVKVDGTVLDQLVYDSFANIMSETTAANGDRFKFTGREYDSEIGQYYYRARDYSPSVGRFESEDPEGFKAGDANLYRYVGNNPTNATDPSGRAAAFVATPWAKILQIAFQDRIEGVWRFLCPYDLTRYRGKWIRIAMQFHAEVPSSAPQNPLKAYEFKTLIRSSGLTGFNAFREDGHGERNVWLPRGSAADLWVTSNWFRVVAGVHQVQAFVWVAGGSGDRHYCPWYVREWWQPKRTFV